MFPNNWHIRNLVLHNFRNYENFSISFESGVTLLIGENGAGKTAILDALAIMLWTPLGALSGNGRGGRHFKTTDASKVPYDLDSSKNLATAESRFPVMAEVNARLGTDNFSWQRTLGSPSGRTTLGNSALRNYMQLLGDKATSGDFMIKLPVIAYYGVDRLNGEVSKNPEVPVSRRGAYELALDPHAGAKRLGGMLHSLDEQILRAKAFDDPTPTAAIQQFNAIQSACDNILSPVGWHRPRWNSTVSDITLQHRKHGTLPLSMLASGTKIVAGLAIDLASRMARANPQLSAETLLQQTPGIVLIDEVDLHLHPQWQRQLIPTLRRTFPQIQFILTTHSPQVISTVEADKIRILHDSTVTIPDYAEGLQSNVILKHLQGTDPRPEVEIREKLDKYMEMVHQGEGNTEDARLLREEIDKEMGGSDYNEELITADAILTFDGWED